MKSAQLRGARTEVRSIPMRAVLFTVIALSLFYQCSAEELHYGPGVMAPSEPQQARVSNVAPFEWEGYQIKPLARFDIEARVLSKARYRMVSCSASRYFL